MDKKPRVLVIIPAYNEEKIIGSVIKEVQENISDADVVVIDDGSRDGTAKVAREVPVIMHEDISRKSLLGGARFIYYGFKVFLSVIVALLREKPSRERRK